MLAFRLSLFHITFSDDSRSRTVLKLVGVDIKCVQRPNRGAVRRVDALLSLTIDYRCDQ